MLINVTDIPIEGADPLSTQYQLNMIGVNKTLLEALERQKPLVAQNGTLPDAKVSINSVGQVTISFNTNLQFPVDMVEKINKFTTPIVVAPNKPFVPKPNEFGFFDIPYIKFTILASDDSDPDELAYTYEAT